MSFQFKKLTLQNWLVYGGKIEVDFVAPENGRNLIVFYGKNGFGKTSLLKALQFVFHGRLDRDELFTLWHDNMKDEGYGELEVTLQFTYEGHVCQLTRMASFGRMGNSYSCSPQVKLVINGENREDQIQDIIAQMIPYETQQFVFFDGAEITRYSKRQHEDGVKEAIEQVLGIPAIRNLRYDLQRLIKELEDEQADIIAREDHQNDLLRQKLETEELIAGFEERIKTATDRLDGLKEALKKLQGEELEIRMFESDSRLLDEKQSRFADYEESLKKLDEEVEQLLRQAPMRMLISPLSQLLVKAEAQQKVSRKRAMTIERKRLIEEILETGNCICERDVDNEVASILERSLQRMEALVGDTGDKRELSASEFNKLTRILNEQKAQQNSAPELIERRATILDRMDEADTDIRRLKEKLQGHEDTTISSLYSQKASLEDQLETEQKRLAMLESELEKARRNLDDIQRQLDQQTAQSAQGEALNKTLKRTRSLYTAVSEYVEQLVEFKRQHIEGITTDIFLSITNKPDEYAGVHVKEDYTLQVYRKDNSIVDNDRLSAGEKEVLAYSFITALNLSTNTPAPFVMDTPFGHLDATHRNRLLDSLPQLDVQILLLATDRDLPPSERNRIQPFIQQEFEIVRDQRHAQSLIEHMS